QMPSSVIFTPQNWNQPQALNMGSVGDGNFVNDVYTVDFSAPNAGSSQVTVTVLDNQLLAVSPVEFTDNTGQPICSGEQPFLSLFFNDSPMTGIQVTVPFKNDSKPPAILDIKPNTMKFDETNWKDIQQTNIIAASDLGIFEVRTATIFVSAPGQTT